MRKIFNIFFIGSFVTCATTAPGSSPDEMSAEEHRAEAAAYTARAAEHQARYNSEAISRRRRRFPGGQSLSGVDFSFSETIYNPTRKHLRHARERSEHARQHAAAARALEAYEQQECGLFPKATRVRCPIMDQVDRVENIEGGIRMTLVDKAPIDAVLAHMRCHYAYARTQGRKGMNRCPLYLQNIVITQVGDRELSITSTSDDVTDEIRRRMADHIDGD